MSTSFGQIILASGSPRRKQLLSLLELPFTVEVAEVPEIRLSQEPPEDMVVRLSFDKARAVASSCPGAIVIGSDTSVSLGKGLDARVFGKPRDKGELREMLGELLGRSHYVHTGYAVVDLSNGRAASGFEEVSVNLRTLSPEEIEAYIASGIGDDKAGGYAVQDRGFKLVAAINGCAAATMGLPLCPLHSILRDWGLHLPPLATVEHGCTQLTGLPCCISRQCNSQERETP